MFPHSFFAARWFPGNYFAPTTIGSVAIPDVSGSPRGLFFPLYPPDDRRARDEEEVLIAFAAGLL